MNNYRFERLSEQNLHFLVTLYKLSFKLNTDINYLKKKYDTTLFGVSFIGFLAFETQTNEVAGYYGVFPIPTQINNTKILAAQSGDTMTNPKHQGKGLFTTLAKMTYDLAKQEGISFVFGFPNANSYPGFIKKLNWKHYNDVNTYVIKTATFPFEKIVKKISLLKPLYDNFIKKELEKKCINSRLHNSLEQQDENLGFVLHDADFYEYKKYTKFYSIKLNGITCVIKVDGRMWVGDIEYCSKEKFITTIDSLVKLAKKIHCSSVQFSLFNNTFYDTILKEKFELKSKNPVGAINLKEEVDVTKFAFQAIDFDTY